MTEHNRVRETVGPDWFVEPGWHGTDFHCPVSAVFEISLEAGTLAAEGVCRVLGQTVPGLARAELRR
ncbi:hypothetical protein D3C84_1129640 [compost metagenome]